MNFLKSVLIGLLISSQAFAGLPPTTAKGQSDPSAKVTFNLHAPESQMTRINGTTALIETGNRNVLANPGFEGGTAAWAITGGGATLSTVTVGQATGKRSAIWSTPAQNSVLYSGWQTVSAGDGFSGQNGVVSCRFKCASGNCTHTFEAWGGALADLSPVTPITSSTTQYVRSTANFIYPASGVVRIHVNAVAVAEPDLLVDDCYMGLAEGFNLTQATGAISTPWVLYPATIQGFTVTSQAIYWRRVGDSIELRGYVDPSAGGAALIQIGLPPGVVTASSIAATGEISGSITRKVAPGLVGNLILTPSVGYVQVSVDDPSLTAITPAQGLNIGGTYFAFVSDPIPVEGWSANVNGLNYLTQAPSGPTMQKFTAGGSFGNYSLPTNPRPSYIRVRMVGGGGGGGGSSNSSNNAGAGSTGTTTTFGTALLTANPGTGGSGQAGSGGGTGGTASLGTAVGLAFTGGNGQYSGGNTANYMTVPMGGANAFGGAGSSTAPASPNTGAGGGAGAQPSTGFSGAGGGAGGFIDAVIYPVQNTYAFSVGAGGAGGGAGSAGNAGGSGADGLIEVTEYYGNGQVPAFIGSVTSNTSGQERIERVNVPSICSASPCIISSQSGNWVSSITRSGPGNYNLNINSGIFSGEPTCMVTSLNATYVAQGELAPTPTSWNFYGFNAGSNTLLDIPFSIICMGPR